jgi:hypothetical protein
MPPSCPTVGGFGTDRSDVSIRVPQAPSAVSDCLVEPANGWAGNRYNKPPGLCCLLARLRASAFYVCSSALCWLHGQMEVCKRGYSSFIRDEGRCVLIPCTGAGFEAKLGMYVPSPASGTFLLPWQDVLCDPLPFQWPWHGDLTLW